MLILTQMKQTKGLTIIPCSSFYIAFVTIERKEDRLTKSFEKLSSGKLSIKEQCIIDGVVGPAHTDKKNIHAAWGNTQKKEKQEKKA